MRGLAYCFFIFLPPTRTYSVLVSSLFINLLQNSHLLIDFVTNFASFAPCSRLFQAGYNGVRTVDSFIIHLTFWFWF